MPTASIGPDWSVTTTTTTPDITDVDFAHSPTIGKIGAALAKAQRKIQHAKADSTNPHFKSTYADLASVIDAVREPLAENEIARTQFPLSREGEVGLLTMLIHSSGEWIRARVFCRPLQAGPQPFGSVLTYLRRYTLAAVAGLAQEDDDANAADAPRVTPGPPRLSQGQQAEIKILQGELKIPAEQWRAKLTQHFGVSSSTELSPEQARELIAMLERSKAMRTSPQTDTPAST